jgi:hypothetical protein
MQNSQRPTDNPALDQAVALANEQGVDVTAYLAFDAGVSHATARTFTSVSSLNAASPPPYGSSHRSRVSSGWPARPTPAPW